jgi:hypothetical protein
MRLASSAPRLGAARPLTAIHRALAAAIAATLFRLALYLALSLPYGSISAALCHHDCDFYTRIAAEGYGSDAGYHDRGSFPNWAYFPLLPLLMRLGAYLSGGGIFAAALGAAAVALALLAWFGGMYLERARPDGRMGVWLLGLFAAPYGFFFSVPYTEGLFAAAAMGVLLARQLRMPMAAAACAAIGSAARPTGIILSALVVADQAASWWRRRHETPHMAVMAEVLPPIALCALGLSLYMAWQVWQVGDPLAFAHVQVIWDRRWLGPLTWLRLGWRTQDWANLAGPFAVQSFAFNALAAVIGLAAGVWLALRRRFAEAWLCVAALLLPLGSGLHSMPRFVGTNPAFLLAGYDLLAWLRRRTPRGFWAAIAVLAGLQLLLLTSWYSRAPGLF